MFINVGHEGNKRESVTVIISFWGPEGKYFLDRTATSKRNPGCERGGKGLYHMVGFKNIHICILCVFYAQPAVQSSQYG